MSDNNRPEWTSGPEWLFWDYKNQNMTRKFGSFYVYISSRMMTITRQYGESVTMKIASPAHALTAANALAEAAGGWE